MTPLMLPLWVTNLVAYPGVLLPLNLFDQGTLRMIRQVLELPHHQRLFFMAIPPQLDDPVTPPAFTLLSSWELGFDEVYLKTLFFLWSL